MNGGSYMHNHENNILIKNKLESANLDILIEFFKILSDKTKLKIIIALLNDKHCVHDLCEIVDSTQSNISHALAKMKVLNIVKEEKVGKHVFYEVFDEHIKSFLEIALTHMEVCYEKRV